MCYGSLASGRIPETYRMFDYVISFSRNETQFKKKRIQKTIITIFLSNELKGRKFDAIFFQAIS